MIWSDATSRCASTSARTRKSRTDKCPVDGKDAYAVAQFFAQVARAYLVLSLGAAVEKGFTTAPEGVVVPRDEMMTGEWDWHRVVPELDAILKEDVPAIADRRGDITLRIRVSTEGNDPTTGKPKRLWRWKAFTYSDRKWYKRYVGNVEVEPIMGVRSGCPCQARCGHSVDRASPTYLRPVQTHDTIAIP